MKNKFIVVLFLILLCFCCFGCSYDQSKVKLHSKSHAQRIVNRTYGKAEYLGKKQIHEYRIEYSFRDKYYGFVYHFYSYSSQFCMDGSCGMYHRWKEIDYPVSFMEYILEEHKSEIDEIINKYGVEISIPDDRFSRDVLYISQYPYDYDNKVKPAIEELKEIIQKVDDKKALKEYVLRIRKYDDTGTKFKGRGTGIAIWDEE